MKLISQFASTMSASQQGQISTLLQQGIDLGRFESSSQMRSGLEALGALVETVPVPLFTYFLMVGHELVDSGRLNSEFRLFQLDMETIYTELDAIQDMVLAQDYWMNQKIVDTKNVLAALDTRISTLELLADESDYNLAFINTFNMLGSATLSRSDAQAGAVYVDTRPTPSVAMGSLTDMSLDVHRQGLVLPVSGTTSLPIMGINLLQGHDSTQSYLDIDPVNNSLINILAEGDDKYWVRGVLILDQDAFGNPITPIENGAVAQIQLILGGYQSLNSITLAPWADGPFELDDIQYRSIGGGWFSLLGGTVTINDRVTLVFETITTNELNLRIREKSYTQLVDFNYSTQGHTAQAIRSLSDQGTLYNVSLGSGSDEVTHAKGYLYSMGFDFIGVERVKFGPKGIYVASPLVTTAPPSELTVKEVVVNSVDSLGMTQSCVEFDVIKHDYDIDDVLLSSDQFPVSRTTSVVAERLPIGSDGLMALRRFPTYGSVKIYRDGTLLTAGTDYDVSINGGLGYVTSPTGAPVGPPIRYIVRILTPLAASNYTADYTAATVNPDSGEPVWLNTARTAKAGNNSIRFVARPDQGVVAYSKIFLRIISYSFDLLPTRASPLVAEYSLLIRESTNAI